MQIALDMKSFSRFAEVVKKTGPKQQVFLKTAVKKATQLVYNQAKIESPVDTGDLRGSMEYLTQGLRGEVFPTVPYALKVHEMRDKDIQYYSWKTRKFHKKKSRPKYMEKALEKMLPKIDNKFNEAIEKTINLLANA